MKTIEYKFVDRTGWDPGPWDSEPDKVQWQDPVTGLPCLAVRNFTQGFWCGYVGVAAGHPYFGKLESELITLDCHGGLTFSGLCVADDKEHGICHLPDPGEPDRVWWFGFDCMHAFDAAPGMDIVLKKIGSKRWHSGHLQDTYKTLAYVKAQCASLAQQLKNVAAEAPHTKGPVDEPA